MNRRFAHDRSHRRQSAWLGVALGVVLLLGIILAVWGAVSLFDWNTDQYYTGRF